MEAIAILTAVKDASEVIAKFTRLCNRYIQLPAELNDIEGSLSGCEHVLASWKRRWGIREHHPTRYYETLWGRNGWQEIRLCLGGLRDISRHVNTEIFKLVGSATKFSGRALPARPDIYVGQYDEELVRESVKRIARSTTRWRRFARAFGDVASELQEEIRRFDQKLRTLRRMSNGNAENIHREEFQRIRHLRGPDLVRLITGRPYRDSRKNAQLLYKAFKSSRDLVCNVGLTVVQDPHSRPPSRSPSGRRRRSRSPRTPLPPDPEKDFQMFLFDGTIGFEVLVHPVRFPGNPDRDLFCHNLEQVARELVQNTEPKPSYLLTPDSTFEQGFSISRSTDAALNSLMQRPPGSQNFAGQRLQDKIIVANTLAEACARLLGSSWLDFMELDNLRGRYSTGDTWAGILDAEPGDQRTTEVLERVASVYRRGEHSIAQHCHVYRLGLALTELALGRPVTYVLYDRRDGVNVVVDHISDQPLDRYRIATEVEYETNPKFGDIVFFCLSVLQDQRVLRAKDLDDDLITKVLEPLKDQVKVVRAGSTI